MRGERKFFLLEKGYSNSNIGKMTFLSHDGTIEKEVESE